MKRAFTLLELLVVIGIMGLLGSASVGGYRAMQRGMEERGVLQNVQHFLNSAYERAQIDRQPVAVYFWNETRRAESDTETLIVVGRAVAVRRSGRLTYVKGNLLGDEFADLRFNRLLLADGSEDTSSANAGKGAGVFLYKLNGNETSPERSIIAKNTVRISVKEPLPSVAVLKEEEGLGVEMVQEPETSILRTLVDETEPSIELYAYRMLNANGTTWNIADAYGFEFAELELPHNYIFGSQYSTTTGNPVAGETMLRFKVAVNSGEGASGSSGQGVTVSALRQRDGAMSAQAIGTPYVNLNQKN